MTIATAESYTFLGNVASLVGTAVIYNILER